MVQLAAINMIIPLRKLLLQAQHITIAAAVQNAPRYPYWANIEIAAAESGGGTPPMLWLFPISKNFSTNWDAIITLKLSFSTFEVFWL